VERTAPRRRASTGRGRLYHVIDQWGAIYSADPLRAILPPYAGPRPVWRCRRRGPRHLHLHPLEAAAESRLSLDTVIAGAFFAQGIARWGNFFNQELYGPPTNLPWGIAIDCAHRVAPWFSPPQGTFDLSTGFQPLFFYESALDILGGLLVLYLSPPLPCAGSERAIWLRLGHLVRPDHVPGSRRLAQEAGARGRARAGRQDAERRLVEEQRLEARAEIERSPVAGRTRAQRDGRSRLRCPTAGSSAARTAPVEEVAPARDALGEKNAPAMTVSSDNAIGSRFQRVVDEDAEGRAGDTAIQAEAPRRAAGSRAVGSAL